MSTHTTTTKELGAGLKPEHDEHLSELGLEDDSIDTADPAFVKAIKKKIDWRICAVLGILYTVSLVDRVNLPVSPPESSFAGSRSAFCFKRHLLTRKR